MLIFFDKSFIDCSFKTRLERQKDQIDSFLGKIWLSVSVFIEKISLRIWKAKRYLKSLSYKPISEVEFIISPSAVSYRDNNGMTIDQLISRDGGILSHADGKTYTSKRSYLESIKAKGCYIKE